MKEIKLSVEDKNLDTVLMILNNLKTGLLSSIEINGKVGKKQTSQYRPKINTVIKEEESGTSI
jgi:hypothetical protein